MKLWGSEVEVGDEVYHIDYGKGNIIYIQEGLSYLPFQYQPEGRNIQIWCNASSLSWIPFPEFDRGKKKAKIKKWKWAFGDKTMPLSISAKHMTEEEAEEHQKNAPYEWKHRIDETEIEEEE